MRVTSFRAGRAAAFLSLASVGAMAACLAAPAQAQTAGTRYQFDIPAQSLESALLQFNRVTGVQLVYPSSMTEGLSSQGASGSLTADEALARLLSGTGLTFRRMGTGTITIEKVVASDGGERVLGAVRVQGAQDGGLAGSTPVNGVNGSRDVTATEGTGSYTSNALTVGSKTAQSIKDTPMAVSVLTDQRIKDQNITDLNSAMRNLPGVSLLQAGSQDFSFVSRGFVISQLQIDGGAAQNFSFDRGLYRPIIDMSLYDHVELVRGATGTFNAYGDPGGVINLVRKRPLDHPQMLIDMQVGSWNWHRVSVDVTGPLAFSGKLRARVIATHQDNKFFYDVAKSNLSMISGTLELDVTPTTLLTGGANYQDQRATPWYYGLPRLINGKMLPLPRSFSTAFPWARDDRTNLEFFAQIEQQIGSQWSFKFKGTRIRQNGFFSTESVAAPVDPATGGGASFTPSFANLTRTKQTLLEATLNGGFRLFGNVQKLTIGANYSMADPSGTKQLESVGNIFPGKTKNIFGSYNINIFQFKASDWAPAAPVYTAESSGYENGDLRYLNAYASFDFVPLRRVHIISSVRFSGFRSQYLQYYICGVGRQQRDDLGCASKPTGTKVYAQSGQRVSGSQFSWPPSVQAKFDATNNMTMYASYTDIYIDRSSILDANHNPLPPTTGRNLEGGVKWLSPDKKLNVDLSIYYTKKVDIDVQFVSSGGSGPDLPGVLNKVGYCCYRNFPDSYATSYGADLEVTGELARGWQLSFGYTYNVNKSHSPGYLNFDGTTPAIESQAPRHLAKIWSTYDFLEGRLTGLRLGLGAQLQSRTSVADSYCSGAVIQSIFGPQCAIPQTQVFFSDPGYLVFNGSVGYKFNDRMRLDVELANIFDKTYLTYVGRLYSGSYYGAPRSFKVTARTSF